MDIVFMGSAEFAVPSLAALARSRHRLAAIYTQPPRPAGRGHQMQPTAVHEAAQRLGLEPRTPATLKTADVQAEFRALGADLGVVAAYGLILPKAILDAPRLGCVNLHGSLLPRWRGAAPVERAIEAGDAETGVMIFQMEPGLDTGPVFSTASVVIEPRTTAPALRARLAERAAELLVALLDPLEAGRATARPQPSAGVTYAHKLDKNEFRLDFDATADLLERRIRAFHPNAWFALGDQRLRVLEAEIAADAGAPGTTVDAALTIACGKAALRPLVVQPAGKRAMATADFLRGRPVAAGTRLG